jgi:hypothetical protein
MATQSPQHGSVAANAAVNGIVKQDEAKGRVPVHIFDPEATPKEKAAAAGKGRDQLKSVNKVEGAGEKGMFNSLSHAHCLRAPDFQALNTRLIEVSVSSGSGKNAVPTITVSDADSGKKHDNGKAIAGEDGVPKPPGDLQHGLAPTIPDWYRVGWRSVSGIDAPPLPEGEERDKGVLDMFLSEQMYGDWYHNAALIFFVSFFITVCNNIFLF